MKQMESATAAGSPADQRACYRYRTPVLVGPWRRQSDMALEDAVKAGQARSDDSGGLNWLVNGGIEESRCGQPGACRGVYPSE